jgi:hypothetical protein
MASQCVAKKMKLTTWRGGRSKQETTAAGNAGAVSKKYGFICSNATRDPVNHLSRAQSVESSAYYSWCGRTAKVIETEELELRRRTKVSFSEARASRGSRTMTSNLRAEGVAAGRDRDLDLTKTLGLRGEQKRKYEVSADSRHDYPIANNVLNLAFSPYAPNKGRCVGISYLCTQERWIYLLVFSSKRDPHDVQVCRTRCEAIADEPESIVSYDSRKRLQSTSGCINPINHESTLNDVSGIS